MEKHTIFMVGRHKMSILPQTIYMFNVIPIKIPTAFLAEMRKSILKFVKNLKGPQIAKKNIEKQESWKSHTS